MKCHVLVFDNGSSSDIDLQAFVEALDSGAGVYALNEHTCFVRSAMSASEISDRFQTFARLNFFFVTELKISESEYAGRMPVAFWDFVESEQGAALESAAE